MRERPVAMPRHEVHNKNCDDFLDQLIEQRARVPLLIADPPDNLGLAYDQFKDRMLADDYYNWQELLIRKSLQVADSVWWSYYWSHDLEIKHRVRNIIKFINPSVTAKSLLWRYTFGQYNDHDCGSGFRFLLRLDKPTAKNRADSIRVTSRRMELGDSRASGPKVPDDVWEFSRVVGNAAERRGWHPTQHPEDLYQRIVLFRTDPGDTVVDLFGGTGTAVRVCERLDRRALISEISRQYCQNICAENPTSVMT